MVLNSINFYEIPNFLLISIVGMILIALIFGLVLGRFIFAPILTFVLLGIAAFILPNFFDIKFQPLLGYAAFLTVLSLLLSILFWFMTKDYRKNKKLKLQAKLQQKKFDENQNRAEMESIKHHENLTNH
ncbi:Sec62 family protein translocation protein [Macrococcus capreoli]|uniref:Sec62 family protein translocation protein n=2 Tax=Macrococcus capreoli TaxID=2982690 RepID=UPI0021D5C895|nr:Sec62 family protein translocation protein [Macrococcus sp. TMW 2.2395]MCU7558495.1 Sec62 family protein translocation protein [Macrococcus sp. TMW 2.2395]